MPRAEGRLAHQRDREVPGNAPYPDPVAPAARAARDEDSGTTVEREVADSRRDVERPRRPKLLVDDAERDEFQHARRSAMRLAEIVVIDDPRRLDLGVVPPVLDAHDRGHSVAKPNGIHTVRRRQQRHTSRDVEGVRGGRKGPVAPKRAGAGVVERQSVRLVGRGAPGRQDDERTSEQNNSLRRAQVREAVLTYEVRSSVHRDRVSRLDHSNRSGRL